MIERSDKLKILVLILKSLIIDVVDFIILLRINIYLYTTNHISVLQCTCHCPVYTVQYLVSLTTVCASALQYIHGQLHIVSNTD